MAYDRLADAIIKHAKLIMVAWIVILLVAAYPAINAFQNMSYDMNEMGIEESESMEGFEIIGTYFPSSDADASALPMLVIGYDDGEERQQALAIAEILQRAPAEGAFTYELEDGSTAARTTGRGSSSCPCPTPRVGPATRSTTPPSSGSRSIRS